MKVNLLNLSVGFSILGLSLSVNSAFAQKAKKIQDESVWMHALRVDGKTNDWQTPLQAENKTTGLAYTLANDDRNLYLMIQANDRKNNAKIMLGGISFAINTDGEKDRDKAYNVTFPVVSSSGVDLRGAVRVSREERGISAAERDSMEMAAGNAQLDTLKYIAVDGFKDIADSVVSIYNSYGLKAAARFDRKGCYSYELAIPLKLLGLSPADPQEFAYNIRLNGAPEGNTNRGYGRRRGNFGRGNLDMLDMLSPTDFWGKYTLAQSSTDQRSVSKK
jgi:hypothetical protein